MTIPEIAYMLGVDTDRLHGTVLDPGNPRYQYSVYQYGRRMVEKLIAPYHPHTNHWDCMYLCNFDALKYELARVPNAS